MIKSKGDTAAATIDSDDILVQSYCFLIPYLTLISIENVWRDRGQQAGPGPHRERGAVPQDGLQGQQEDQSQDKNRHFDRRL